MKLSEYFKHQHSQEMPTHLKSELFSRIQKEKNWIEISTKIPSKIFFFASKRIMYTSLAAILVSADVWNTQKASFSQIKNTKPFHYGIRKKLKFVTKLYRFFCAEILDKIFSAFFCFFLLLEYNVDIEFYIKQMSWIKL